MSQSLEAWKLGRRQLTLTYAMMHKSVAFLMVCIVLISSGRKANCNWGTIMGSGTKNLVHQELSQCKSCLGSAFPRIRIYNRRPRGFLPRDGVRECQINLLPKAHRCGPS